VTKLNESVQSDISVKSKISNEKDEDIELVIQNIKETEKKKFERERTKYCNSS